MVTVVATPSTFYNRWLPSIWTASSKGHLSATNLVCILLSKIELIFCNFYKNWVYFAAKNIELISYHIAQILTGGNFWCFWCFPAGPSKFNLSNCFKTIQHLQVYGKGQWPSIKIFFVKYLKSQYLSKFPHIKILCYTVYLVADLVYC